LTRILDYAKIIFGEMGVRQLFLWNFYDKLTDIIKRQRDLRLVRDCVIRHH